MSSDRFLQEIQDYKQIVLQEKKTSRLADPAKLAEVTNHMDKVYTRQSALFCIDVEAWERSTSRITEVGVSVYDPRGQENAMVPNIKTFHFIVEENKHLKNGRYVPEHSRNFSGVTSHVMPTAKICAALQKWIDIYFVDTSFPCFLVGHAVDGDVKWLRLMRINFPRDALVLDTQKLFAQSHGKAGSSLKNALASVNQPFAFLHNAGNDAYFTLLLALKLCDPSIRKLLKFDVIPPDEDTTVPRTYPKTLTNKSAIEYTSEL